MNRLIQALILIPSIVFGWKLGQYVSNRISDPHERYVAVVDKALPTTVTIDVALSRINPETHRKEFGGVVGSGVFITSNGHILTCNHLFNFEKGVKIESITVTAHDHTMVAGTLLVQSLQQDLAVLKTEYYGPFSRIARPDSPQVGQEVIAIGSPMTIDGTVLEGTVTTGIISALSRDVIHYDTLQLSTAINPGNSGGPLFNLRGEVVGINQAIGMTVPFPIWTGLGFAASASEINKFLVHSKIHKEVRECAQ